MGETQHNKKTPSRMDLIHTGGEIVEVQGGHIVRSTGRKDRHSKVCTAKGARDRRVRLSAHTAIQFYDVQDRLGYDRPSKAVDWLIKKAKAAIDELEKLPAWNPTSSGWAAANSNSKRGAMGGSSSIMVVGHDIPNDQQMLDMGYGNNCSNNTHNPSQYNNNSSFLPPSLDSDSIANNIKSFFPIGGSSASMGDNSSPMQFHSFPPPPDLRQDLRLSLQSIDDPILLHHHHQQQQSATHQTDLFASPAGVEFDISSANWSDHQRMAAWNVGGDGIAASIGAVVGGFDFNSPPLLQPLLIGQNQNNNQFVSSQRGPLQSSNNPSIRAWIDPSSYTYDHHHYHHQNLPIYPSSFGGFSGFHIPARIQGEEEEHDGISNKPSSASSDSRH